MALDEGAEVAELGVGGELDERSAGASLIPGPVGWVAAGLSVGWGVASMLSGDVPVTKRITDGLSSAWNWLTGG